MGASMNTEKEEKQLSDLEEKTINKYKIENSKSKKRKIGIKESVLTTVVLGYVGSFLTFMWFYQTDDITYLKQVITIWLVVGLAMMIFGLNKGSLLAFGATLIQVATDKTLTTENKLALIMIIIQDWLNIAAGLSQIVNIKEKQKS